MLFKAFRPQAPNEAEESADLSQKPLFLTQLDNQVPNNEEHSTAAAS
jgi:hypothetical protein